MSLIAAYATRISGAGAGVWSKPRLSTHRPSPFLHAVLALAFVASAASWKCLGADNNLPPPATVHLEETNSRALRHTYLQLQQQIHTTQLAIEQSRQETREAAAQTAGALSNALHTIQETFAARRTRDLDAMRSFNQVMLIVVGVSAAIGFLTMLMLTYFQWRMSKGLAKISATLPTALGLDPASAASALALANHPELPLFGTADRPAARTHGMSNGDRLFHEPGALVRRRRFRAVSMAVIVGLICAAGLALLLYVVAYRKLGFG